MNHQAIEQAVEKLATGLEQCYVDLMREEGITYQGDITYKIAASVRVFANDLATAMGHNAETCEAAVALLRRHKELYGEQNDPEHKWYRDRDALLARIDKEDHD